MTLDRIIDTEGKIASSTNRLQANQKDLCYGFSTLEYEEANDIIIYVQSSGID
jgi:hypothetical protein